MTTQNRKQDQNIVPTEEESKENKTTKYGEKKKKQESKVKQNFIKRSIFIIKNSHRNRTKKEKKYTKLQEAKVEIYKGNKKYDLKK